MTTRGSFASCVKTCIKSVTSLGSVSRSQMISKWSLSNFKEYFTGHRVPVSFAVNVSGIPTKAESKVDFPALSRPIIAMLGGLRSWQPQVVRDASLVMNFESVQWSMCNPHNLSSRPNSS